jgi:hypothetical protein
MPAANSGEEHAVKGLMVILVTLLVGLLASTGYAARDTHFMRHWHPMLVEPVLGRLGLFFFGHEHTNNEHPVEDGAFIDAPITSCWNYDFLEKDCDGPDHYKAFVADGSALDSKIGAYKGDPGSGSPPRARACGVKGERTYCVSDYSDDGETVWRETHHNLESHALAVGCPGPRLELPCRSKDP